MGLHFNGTSNFLYEAEFSNPINAIKDGTLKQAQFALWIMLLIAHIGVVSLPFLTKKSYFKPLLIVNPLAFIIIYILLATVFVIILLIPFIIVWLICIMKFRDDNRKQDRLNKSEI